MMTPLQRTMLMIEMRSLQDRIREALDNLKIHADHHMEGDRKRLQSSMSDISRKYRNAIKQQKKERGNE